MPQIIAITVKDKIASTDFREVVSFNNNYRLSFTFDEEWDEFQQRVAVVLWADGGAEKAFTGTECEMPAVTSPACDSVSIGVYGANGDGKIASSLARISCRTGAHGVPAVKNQESLHEQILAMVGSRDWSVFDEKVNEGVYSAVRVDGKGFVTEGWKLIEVLDDGQAPDGDLAVGGLFFVRADDVYKPFFNGADGLKELTVASGKLDHSLIVGNKTFDGGAEVEVTADDLSLAAVASSGSYHDLTDKPDLSTAGAVSSVNGETGEVVLTKSSFGLEALTGHRQFPLIGFADIEDMDELTENGFYFVRADSDHPVFNMPTSSKNTGSLSSEWFALVLDFGDEGTNFVQLVISARADNAVRLRSCADGAFSAWKTVI